MCPVRGEGRARTVDTRPWSGSVVWQSLAGVPRMTGSDELPGLVGSPLPGWQQAQGEGNGAGVGSSSGSTSLSGRQGRHWKEGAAPL